MPLDIKTTVAELKNLYKTVDPKLRALILGEKGVGKTSLARSCPKPVLLHSFDPRGTESLRDLIESGDVITSTACEFEDYRDPKSYITWETEFNNWGNIKLFNSIGTYMIDSTTLMSDAILNQICKKEGRIMPPMNVKYTKDGSSGKGMRIMDWETNFLVWKMLSMALLKLPCHVIVTGHIDKHIDESSQSYVRSLMLPGKSSERVPILFPEVYILHARNIDGKIVRTLQTKNDGEYRAGSRADFSSKLELHEPADIKALLKKVGYNYEDKEPL